MAFYYNKALRKVVFEGELTGLDSVTFSDGTHAVKSSELQNVKNELDSEMGALRQTVDSKSLKVIKRNGSITSINIS